MWQCSLKRNNDKYHEHKTARLEISLVHTSFDAPLRQQGSKKDEEDI